MRLPSQSLIDAVGGALAALNRGATDDRLAPAQRVELAEAAEQLVFALAVDVVKSGNGPAMPEMVRVWRHHDAAGYALFVESLPPAERAAHDAALDEYGSEGG